MKESLSKITDKQVINISDGRFLGYVNDFCIDICQGCITDIIIPTECGFFGAKKGKDIVVPWNKICKIGKDAIIVDISYPQGGDCDCENNSEKRVYKS